MQAKIKRVDTGLPLPKYETKGSVGMDLLARETTTITAGSIGLIPGNIIVETPPGYMLMIASRSSTPRKKGLMFPHSIGVIDQDYCGEADEILIQVYNFTDTDVTIKRGEKIAQAIFVRVDQAQLLEVTEMSEVSRGGFGSTDNK
jgi:dUTP pyrophosphatase